MNTTTTPLTNELTTQLNRILALGEPATCTRLQLRCLIRNSEARIDHLTAWVNALQPGDWCPPDLEQQIERAHAQLAHHRARLEGRTILRECATLSPAVSLAGSAGFRAR